jgi:hypothetical protein
LTPFGTSRGFVLTTYASGFPDTAGGTGIGPIGIAFRTDGKVLVTDFVNSNIYLLPSHADGQTGGYPVATAYGPGSNKAIALAQVQNGNQWKYYLGQSTPGQISEVDQNGAFVQTIVSVPLSGLAAYPPGGAVTGLTGHLFATAGNDIWDVDVQAMTKTLFASPGGSADGLTFSPDGMTLYVAFNVDNVIRAFDSATGTQTWQSPVIAAGPDGIAIGLGTLTGYVYANCVGGEVWEVGVPGGPHAGAFNMIANGGSRGDFIAVDPNIWSGGSFPSLLLTQSDRIKRLDPPGGGWFGPPTSSTDPVLCLTCFPRVCEPGTAGVNPCPCANPARGPGRGCDNFGPNPAGGSGGATLDGSGTAMIANDTVQFQVRDEIVNGGNVTVLWQGTSVLAAGARTGAGIRCVASNLVRLYKGDASAGSITFPSGLQPNVHTASANKGYAIVPPVTLYYYASYRNSAAGTPCGNPALGFNATNAAAVSWNP